jgi:hypothetical protein
VDAATEAVVAAAVVAGALADAVLALDTAAVTDTAVPLPLAVPWAVPPHAASNEATARPVGRAARKRRRVTAGSRPERRGIADSFHNR